MYFINRVREALYEIEDKKAFDNLIHKFKYTIGRYLSIYKKREELPKGVFELFLETCSTPELYNKDYMDEFIDSVFYVFSEAQKQTLLDTVFKHFNNYPFETQPSFLITLFIILKSMYAPYYITHPTIVDFYARLYLSANEAGKKYIDDSLFQDEWQLVENRIKELNATNNSTN